MRIYRKLYGLAAAVLVVGVALVVLVKLAFRNSTPARVAANTPVIVAPQEAPAAPAPSSATPAGPASKVEPAPPPIHTAILTKDPESGAQTVRLSLYLRELWRYERPQRKWVRVELSSAEGGFLPLAASRLGKVTGSSALGGSVSIDFSKVLAGKPSGLYYLKWSLNGTRGSTLMNAGMKPEDVDTDRLPGGMIKIQVPYEGKSLATCIPDPRKHCVAPTKASTPPQAKSSAAAQPKQASATTPKRSTGVKQSTAAAQ